MVRHDRVQEADHADGDHEEKLGTESHVTNSFIDTWRLLQLVQGGLRVRIRPVETTFDMAWINSRLALLTAEVRKHPTQVHFTVDRQISRQGEVRGTAYTFAGSGLNSDAPRPSSQDLARGGRN